MDWLSIIIAILAFVLPAIFESDKKKKKRKKARLPHPVEDPDMMEMPWMEEEPRLEDDKRRSVQPEFSVPDEITVPEPVAAYDYVEAEEDSPVSVPEAPPVLEVEHVIADTPVEPSAPVQASGRKRRFNARDMVIYSEIMRPKYLENFDKK